MALKSRNEASSAPGPGWVDLASSPGILSRGIFLDSVGLEGSGKSSLALTLAEFGPLAYVNIDQSLDRAHARSKKERERVKRLDVQYAATIGEDATKNTCRPVWANLVKRVDEASAGFAAGAVIDTGTETWELNRLAAFGTLNPKGRTDHLYGPINARQRNLFRTVHRINKKHLITIHQYTDEYKDKRLPSGGIQSVKTGKYVRKGFKEMGYLCDVAVECRRENGEFKAKFLINKLPPNGPDLEGTEIDQDDLTFAHIITISTGTEIGEWLKKATK